ncbi:hypothetical protein A242_29203, partial [Pseudomonas syringae pv. actinidiae ICMP 19095]
MSADGLFDAAAKGVVFVRSHATARQTYANQSVLAVVAVFSDKLLAGAASLADLVAVRIVVVMAVALHQ